MRDFPYLRLGIRDFKREIGARFGIESMRGRWDAKSNPRDYGIARKLGSGLRERKTLLGTLGEYALV